MMSLERLTQSEAKTMLEDYLGLPNPNLSSSAHL